MKLSSLFKNSSGKGSIKICLLGLLLGCLGLTSFSSANSITLTGKVEVASAYCGYGGFTYSIPIPLEKPSLYGSQKLNIVCGYKTARLRDFDSLKVYTNNGLGFDSSTLSSTTCPNEYSNGYNCFSAGNSLYDNATYLSFILGKDYSGLTCDIDYFCSFSGNSVIQEATPCPTCPTCEDCSSCQSSLGACLEDNISLENMNDSLSSELESCLENNPTGCVPGVDTGCVEGTIVPLLSWSVGLDSFTTPIINNLTLPQNYKGKLVDGVLTISSINNNLSISDSDIESIKDSLVEVVLCIFGFSLFLVLIYYIKFYIFNSKK